MASKLEKLLKKARALRDKGKHEKALKYYRNACEEEDCGLDVWIERGDVAARAGIDGEAVDAYFRAAKRRASGGDAEAATELAHKVLALAPDHEGARGLIPAAEAEPDAEAEAKGEAAADAAAADGEGEAEAEAAQADARAEPAAGENGDADAAEAAGKGEPDAAAAAEGEGEAAAEATAADVKAEAEADGAHADAKAEPAAGAEGTGEAEPKPGADGKSDADADADAEPDLAEVSGRIALEDISLAEFAGDGHGAAADYPIDDVTTKGAVLAVAATLSSSPLLSELDGELVAHLIDCGTLRHRLADQTVFREGESGTSLFLILDGKVAVERRDPASRDSRRLAALRPGAFFGEMSLLTDTPRSATVRAITAATLLEVSRAQVRELIAREPKVLKRLMRFFRARMVSNMLATSSLFQGFTASQKRELIPRFRVREIPTDQVVLSEGSPSDGLYLVLAGELAAEVQNGGSPRRLGRLGPGDVFGEMSLLDGAATVARIRTESRAWVLRLSQEDFFELADEHPHLVDQLAAIADKRRADNDSVAYTSIRPV